MASKPEVIEWRKANDPEFVARLRKYSKDYVARNVEKERERQRKSKEDFRNSNRDAYNAYMREWRNKNKDEINAKKRLRLATDKEYAERIRLQDRERHRNNPEAHRRQNLKSNYGITLEEYAQLYENQEGKCLICKGSFPNSGSGGLVVDHCHNEGHIRGLLCAKCNKGLGQFDDDIQRLREAIKYLERK